MDTRLTFPKSERLRHKALVDPLFIEGKSVYAYPLRCVFRPLSEADLHATFKAGVPDRLAPLQVLITVPKKKRRHAVDRVLMRRRIRECYRLQRRALRSAVEEMPDIRTLSVAFIYLADKNIDSATLNAKIGELIAKIQKELKKSNTGTL